MANKNPSEFYRGKRKKTGPALILSIIVLSVIAFVVLLFYGLQKYIVITNDDIRLEIPLLTGQTAAQSQEGEDGAAVKEFEKVDAELIVGEPDYSNIKATAGEKLTAMKAVYVPAQYVSSSLIDTYSGGVTDGNALVLELKTASGMLVWDSDVDFARGYGTSGTVDLKSIVSALKEKNIYLAAKLCCFVDNTVSSRYADSTLKKITGEAFTDGSGVWIDPYNSSYRAYIKGLCKELSAMGFDEIILSDMKMPYADGVQFVYTGTSAAEPGPVTAMSGFALEITRSMKAVPAKISVQLAGESVLNGGESTSGQNPDLLYKIFDRVYVSTDAENAKSIVESGKKFVLSGEPELRTVPMCYGTAPDTSCRVLIN